MIRRVWLLTTYSEHDPEHKKPSYSVFETIEKVYKEYGKNGWEPYDTGNSAFKGFIKKKVVCDLIWNDEAYYSTNTYILQEVNNLEHWNE